MNKLLDALGSNVKKRSGNNGYIAKCPVHNDKDFAMVIDERDGKVVAHCFACGANGYDLYQHLGLPLDELMGEGPRDVISRERREKMEEDRWFIAIYESDIKKGIKPKLNDKRRYRLAKARLGVE